MSNKYEKLANDILVAVGGHENVNSVIHCMTRLRFILKDNSLPNKEAVEAMSGVQGVVISGGQFQIVLGPHVAKVAAEISKNNFVEEVVNDEEENASALSKVLGAISAIFQPLIPAISGAGMIKAVLTLLTAFKVLDNTSQTFILLNTVSDTIFYFLPILLAVSSAKRFKTDPYVAGAIGGLLIHPAFVSMVAQGEAITFMGMPVKLISYGAAVIPPILIVFIQQYVEKFTIKVSPSTIRIFFAPLLQLLIMAPIAIIVVGPLGSYIGDLLYVVFEFLNNEARWLIPVLMGTFTPLFVMTGMHISFMPVQLAQYAALGYGTLLGPGMLASNLAQAGSCFAVGVRTKDKDMKKIAFSAGTTALFGVSEPALYGVTLKLKRPLLAVMIAGGAAGLWGGLVNMRTYASSVAGLTALPVYLGGGIQNVINAVIAIVIALVVGFIVTLILGFEDIEVTETKKDMAK